jgi:hypothetical protein
VPTYKGREIHAKPGLHDHVAPLLERALSKGSTVLDMAAGSGAMSLRLQDLHFLRQCRKLLKSSGSLLLTTLNPNSAPSKALFVRSGHGGWFADEDYRHYGHIAPLTIKVLRECAQENGLQLKHLGSYGDPWEHCAGQPKLTLLAKLIEKVDPAPAAQKGDVLVALLTASS